MPKTPEDRYAKVVSFDGEIVELFNQDDFVGTNSGSSGPRVSAKLCVSLSVIWIRHSERQKRRTRFSKWLAPQTFTSAASQWQSSINKFCDWLGVVVEGQLATWEFRSQLRAKIQLLEERALVDPNQITSIADSDFARPILETLLLTRPASGALWPPWLPPCDLLTPTLTKLARVRTDTLPPWREIAKYGAVDGIVRKWTENKYSTVDYTENVVQNLEARPGSYRLLGVNRADVDANQELRSFAGHMMAAFDDAGGRTFFDPQAGVVHFPAISDFTAWFRVYFDEEYSDSYNASFARSFTVPAR